MEPSAPLRRMFLRFKTHRHRCQRLEDHVRAGEQNLALEKTKECSGVLCWATLLVHLARLGNDPVSFCPELGVGITVFLVMLPDLFAVRVPWIVVRPW